MPVLPAHPSLEHLRKQAKDLRRREGIPLSSAQHELARSYGFASWPRLVRQMQALGLHGIERALVLADPEGLARILAADPGAATAELDGHPPLLVLLHRSSGAPADVRRCADLLLAAGADPGAHTVEYCGEWRRSALFDAVERRDLAMARLLVDAGAEPDEDAFYHACEQRDTAFLDLLCRPGFERLVIHKLDFEDVAGIAWFLEHGADVNAGALHWAIGRGRGTRILRMLLDAGADVNLPDPRTGHRPLAVAARCGHLAAYDLLHAHGARADLDPVDAAVLTLARGGPAVLPAAPPPILGLPGEGHGWLLGQFALLGRTDVVRVLLDDGWGTDTRGWSRFTPLDQAAMHGRTDTVRLLVERGADLADCAFDDEGPTPLDCAIWGAVNNRAPDGDYPGTVALLLAAGAPTRHEPPTGDEEIDALLTSPRES